MFKGCGELGKELPAVFLPFPPLFIPMQVSEVLNPQESKRSLLISEAATCVERAIGGGVIGPVKQRHWLRTGGGCGELVVRETEGD